MKPLLILPVTLLGLALSISALVTIAASSRVNRDPVYSVAAVQAGLERHPEAWVGRTVRVRASATACSISLEQGHFRCRPQPRLRDPDPAAVPGPLPLAWEDPNPALTFMRRVPLLGSLMPAPQEVDWGVVATYRVHLRAAANGPCGATTCYEALLPDASP